MTIPGNVTSIEDSVFSRCTNLTNVKIPDGVTQIGGSAFYKCASLASVTIPASVASIGKYAFLVCTSLATVNYDGTEEQWKAIKDSSCGLSGSTIIGKDTDGKETTWTSD